jgi:hypothetical protein
VLIKYLSWVKASALRGLIPFFIRFDHTNKNFSNPHIAGFTGKIYIPHLDNKSQPLLKKTSLKINISTFKVAGSRMMLKGRREVAPGRRTIGLSLSSLQENFCLGSYDLVQVF